jgi:dihydroorotate dehydrogenase
MNMRDLAIKFTSYAHSILSREWAREGSQLPVLVCIAPDITQERRMQRVTQASHAHAPGLVLWTTTDVLLHEQCQLAPICLQGIAQPNHTLQIGGSHRQSLFDTMLGKYCL